MTAHSDAVLSEIDTLRFPIGRFRLPASITAVEQVEHIETLQLLPQRLKDAVSGLNDPQLDTTYRDGGWTVRQVVHHLADSHANSYVRFKLALTEDWPTIKPYDEEAWAELSDSRLPVDVSLALIAALHARWVTLVGSLTDADFAKGYVHPAGGRQNLAQVVALYAWHSRHHTAHIVNLRERMGW